MTTANDSGSAQAAPENLTPTTFPTPGDELHHEVLVAVAALKAIAGSMLDHPGIPAPVAGLAHGLDFIADGLGRAADAFEDASIQASRIGEEA